MNAKPEREAIARIIDPYAMGEVERDIAEAHQQSILRDRALAKADAIRALFGALVPSPGLPSLLAKKGVAK